MADLKPLLVSMKDAQRILNCSADTLYALISKGEIEDKYLNSSHKIVYASLERFVANLPDERAS